MSDQDFIADAVDRIMQVVLNNERGLRAGRHTTKEVESASGYCYLTTLNTLNCLADCGVIERQRAPKGNAWLWYAPQYDSVA